MRRTAHHFSSIFLLAASLAAMPASAETNLSAAPTVPAPWPPHWYQTVTGGLTLTNLTPVAYFRGLLGMTPAERERMLAGQPEERRAQVLAKVREYEALPREVREERMRQTELHWHLLNLLPLDPAGRNERLKEVSPLYLPVLLSQLAQWDRLPEAMRKALLANKSFLRAYVQQQERSPSRQKDMFGLLPAQQRADWAQALDRWQELPESRREELCQAFRQFFCLSGEERKETVQALSETERRQMEEALRSYADLPPEKQRQCVESFSKFAEMSAEERSQFLQNAAKWEAMNEHERQLWRTLVVKLPPMPPPSYWTNFPALQAGWPTPPTNSMAKAPSSF
jgi:hypothetical protein